MKFCSAILLLIIANNAYASGGAPASPSNVSRISMSTSVPTSVSGGVPLSTPPPRRQDMSSVPRRGSELFQDNSLWESWCHSNRLDLQKKSQIELALLDLMKSPSKNASVDELKSRLVAASDGNYATVTRRSMRNRSPREIEEVNKIQKEELSAIVTQLLITQNSNLGKLVQSSQIDGENARWRFKASFGVALVMAAWGIGSTIWAAS